MRINRVLTQRLHAAIWPFALLVSLNAATPPVGPLPWRFVTERLIAPAEGAKGELGEIVSLAIADDGTVYAMQEKPATILVFGPDGKYLRTIGREGDGPGELRSGVIGVHGDLLMVQDWSARRFSIFRTNGAFVTTVRSLCCQSYGTLHIDREGTAWVEGPARGIESAYLRIDARGRIIDTLAAVSTSVMKAWKAEASTGQTRSIHEVAVPGQPFEMVVLRHDGLIMRGRSDSMRFVLSRTGRDTVRIIEGPTRRLPVTAAEKARLIEGMIEGLPSTALQESLRKVARASDIPDRSNAWNGVFVDRASRAWVMLPGVKAGVGQFGVFDPSGKYLGEVPFETGRPARRWVMGKDRAAALEENEDGLPQIRVYRLETKVK